MPEKFRNKYRISSTRLQHWDYGKNAAYFITICTRDREHFFGEIVNQEMQLNDIGKLAEKYWIEIPNHFPFVELGAFVIMPNHMHGILIINKKDADQTDANEKTNVNGTANVDGITDVETRNCLVSTDTNAPNPPPPTNKTIGQLRFQNQGKNTASSIIGSYKSVVSKQARLINKNFAWQSLFHDHIIRNAEAFDRIQHYVFNNPFNWCEDKFYS